MFLWRSQVLVMRSSQEIKFFKYEFDEEDEKFVWEDMTSIQSRGFLNGNIRNPQFQIIEDEFILFYKFDLETLEPIRTNVMVNFLDCTMARFGNLGKYAVTYKSNEPDFFMFS